MKTLAIAVALVAIVGIVAVPSAALAQWYGPHRALHNYERMSHARWDAQRTALYGNGPVRETLHRARMAVEKTVHVAKELTGNPDLGYYTRFDRRPLAIGGVYPNPMVGGVRQGFGVTPIQTPIYGGAALNRTGGARYPTSYDPNRRLFW